MTRIFLAISLFILQIYILLQGAICFGKLQAPFVLFTISVLIPIAFVLMLLREPQRTSSRYSLQRITVGAIAGLVSIIVCYQSLRAIFDNYLNYSAQSDVIPQLETLYNRYANGIFPYYPLEQFPWHPYPVYMPLNWLPVGLAGPLHCDVRWIGMLFLAIAIALWGIYVWTREDIGIILKGISIAMPSLVIWGYIRWSDLDLGVSLESLIASYYLLLAAGLAFRNLWLVTAGIVLCLLSRYTMVFWLPLFLFIAWDNVAKQKNIIMWAIISISILLIYLIPFYFHDPSILVDGLAYHNRCYVDAWNGLGHPEQSTAFDNGLNFSWFIREYTEGSMEHRVLIARIIQGSVMLVLLVAANITYRKCKQQVNFYDFGLLWLYIILLFFFMFSPLTYTYYYIPFMMVSAVVCARILLHRPLVANH